MILLTCESLRVKPEFNDGCLPAEEDTVNVNQHAVGLDFPGEVVKVHSSVLPACA